MEYVFLHILFLLVAINPLSKIIILWRAKISDGEKYKICYRAALYSIVVVSVFMLLSPLCLGGFRLFIEQYSTPLYCFVLALVLYNIISNDYKRRRSLFCNAFFPFTIPLNIGPAVLLAILLDVAQYDLLHVGIWAVAAIILNFLLVSLSVEAVKLFPIR